MTWDYLLTLCLLLAALGWLYLRAQRSSTRFLLGGSALLACAIITLIHFGILGKRLESSASAQPREVEELGFVSSRACRSCHAEQHSTWAASYHSKMTRPANEVSVVAGFDGQSFRRNGELWELEKRADQYFVRRTQGDTIREHEVEIATGSHHFQAYWYSTGHGNMLDLVPFGYRFPEDKWIPLDAAFVLPPGTQQRTQGRWNTTCNRCHATQPRPRPTQEGFDTVVAELGISCEACHGPAQAHVARHQNPLDRYLAHWSEADDASLINPADLSSRRASQVCGQCHSINGFPDQKALEQYAVHGYEYRAGDDLEDTRVIETGGEDRYWPDGMLRVSGREYNGLIRSPCFDHAGDDSSVLSCLSCHEMHPDKDDPRPLEVWANDQLGREMETNAACLQCHESERDRAAWQAHTHHSEGSTGSLCYNCHMPHTMYGLLKAIRSHEIDSPSVEVTLATGRPNACNLCHLDKTLAWTAEHLRDWYGHEPAESMREGKGLSAEEHSVAAGVLWLLRGDAGLRALMTWHFAWDSALQASGAGWQAPFLGQLLIDPYDAVRFIAARSLNHAPGFKDFNYDFLGPEAERKRAMEAVFASWREFSAGRSAAELLLGPDGNLDRERLRTILAERDDRPVLLSE